MKEIRKGESRHRLLRKESPMFVHKAGYTARRNRITIVGIPFLLIFSVLVLTAFTQQQPITTFDLVLTGGHVMDPESGLDDVRNIGVTSGKITMVSAEPLSGNQTLDVKGLVVSTREAHQDRRTQDGDTLMRDQ